MKKIEKMHLKILALEEKINKTLEKDKKRFNSKRKKIIYGINILLVLLFQELKFLYLLINNFLVENNLEILNFVLQILFLILFTFFIKKTITELKEDKELKKND